MVHVCVLALESNRKLHLLLLCVLTVLTVYTGRKIRISVIIPTVSV